MGRPPIQLSDHGGQGVSGYRQVLAAALAIDTLGPVGHSVWWKVAAAACVFARRFLGVCPPRRVPLSVSQPSMPVVDLERAGVRVFLGGNLA
jgi:hypothetical protein